VWATGVCTIPSGTAGEFSKANWGRSTSKYAVGIKKLDDSRWKEVFIRTERRILAGSSASKEEDLDDDYDIEFDEFDPRMNPPASGEYSLFNLFACFILLNSF
jgi:hypothetical protein